MAYYDASDDDELDRLLADFEEERAVSVLEGEEDPSRGPCRCRYRNAGGCVEDLLIDDDDTLTDAAGRVVIIEERQRIHDPVTGEIRMTAFIVRGRRQPGTDVTSWAICCRKTPPPAPPA
jgi:hypothetical protein